MKYSLSKRAKKQELAELFLNLSDSIEDEVPDVIWKASEFEVDIKQQNINCDINYISTKKGGEFTIKISWITPAAKKKKAAEAAAKTKERLEKKTASKTDAKDKNKPIEIVKEEDIWAEEETWEASSDDDDWDNSDYDDEW
ncbi:MAG: hypothetical protein ACTSQK_02335 [Candidatus Heimdallarchaeota archaeon]